MKVPRRLAYSLFAISVLSLIAVSSASSQVTVTTDKDDYRPGDTVKVSGTGWEPGESVMLVFVETPLIHDAETLYAVADSHGEIYNDEYVIQWHDIGQRFTLTATGLSSGLTAETAFTDAVTTWNGNTSSDWFDNDNWSGNTPGNNDTGIIPSGRPNYPIITTGNATPGTLIIDSGATVTITGGTFKVSKNNTTTDSIRVAGTLIHSGGTFRPDGNSGTTMLFRITSTGVYKIGGANALFGPNSGETINYSFHPNSLVKYEGTVQTISSTPTYGNVEISGDRKKTLAGATTIAGDLTIAASTDTLATNNNNITISGNWMNNGVFQAGAGKVTFTSVGSKTISGTATTTFDSLIVNKGVDTTSVLEATAVISVPSKLRIQNGLFKISSASNFTPFGTTGSIPATAGLWINGATLGGSAGTFTVNGLLRVTIGTLNVGTGSTNNLEFATGSTLQFAGGTTNVSSKLSGTGSTQTTTFRMSGGTLNVTTSGSMATTVYPFDLQATGSSFTMSGGTIVIKRPGDANGNKLGYRNLATTTNVTGGTLQIGDGTVAGLFNINSTAPIWNFTVNGAAADTAKLSANNLTVNNNLTINAGAVLDANNLNINLAANWTNDGTFTPGTGKVTMNGTSAQTMSGTNFNKLTINNNAGITILTNETINDSLRLENGNFTTGASDTVIIGPSGKVVRVNGQVVGNLRVPVGAGSASVTLPIGFNPFTPVTLDFTGSSGGTVTATSKAGHHPNINTSPVDSAKNVNAYWTLTPGLTFTSYNATFFYPASLKDGGANASNFIVGKRDGGSWTSPTVGTKTDTSTQATGMTTMSDFVVGEPSSVVNSISIRKYRATSATDTSSTIAKAWGLKLKTGGATGTVIKSTTTGELDSNGLADGTYYACEADSAAWTHVGYRHDADGAVVATDTCREVVVTGGESKTVSYYNFKPNTITIKKFRSTSSTDTASAIAKTWGLRLKSGSATGDVVDSDETSALTVADLADGTYYACEADSAAWTHVGYRHDADGAVVATDTCREVVVSGGESKTVSYYNFHRNTITINKYRATSSTDTSSTIVRTWGLRLKSGSATGDLMASGNVTTLTVNSDSVADGTYYACEADSTDWSHVGSRVDGEAALLHSLPDTCRAVTVSDGQSRTVDFYNYHTTSITITKYKSSSSTDTTSTTGKTWGLRLKSGSPTGTEVSSATGVSSYTTNLGTDGTYYACEDDSAGWTHVGYRVDEEGAVLHTAPDTCIAVTLEDGRNRTVSFYNFKPNRITIKEFRATSTSDTTSTIEKTWGLKLKQESESGTIIKEVNDTQLDTLGLADGTYFACEAVDSAGWSLIGVRITYANGGSGISVVDSCRQVSVSGGQSRTVSFYNYHNNELRVKKYRATSASDTTSTIQKIWGLRIKSGSPTAAPFFDDESEEFFLEELADGTYYVCEPDSGGWSKIGHRVDSEAAALNSDTCITVTFEDGQSRTVKLYNFHQNKLTVRKHKSTSPTDTITTTPKAWGLKLKSGSETGEILASGNVSTLTVNSDSVADGTYYACEVDSGDGWEHVGYRVDDGGAVLHTPPDTCVVVTVEDGQSRTVSFYNFKPNSITIKKFRSTSSTDTTSTIARTWGLRLKTGSASGTVIKEVHDTELDSVGLGDGTYYACEADSSGDGWINLGGRVSGGFLETPLDTCVTVEVNGGESKVVSFYNFKPNTITIRKYQSSSLTDTTSTTGKVWRLKVKAGSRTGSVVTEADDSVMTATVGDGTYYACEVDSSNWVHIAYRLNSGPAVMSSDSCVEFILTYGESDTVSFYNFKPEGTVLTLSVEPDTIQWSDTVRFTATVTNIDCDEHQPSGFVRFYLLVGGVKKDSIDATVDTTGGGGIGTASALYVANDPNTPPRRYNGVFNGRYDIRADFICDDPNVLDSKGLDSLVIKKEDAVAFYTGPDLVSTKSTNSCDATLTLTATVYDTTAVSPFTDSFGGDIRRAKIKFKITGDLTDSAFANVGLVSSSDSFIGTATATKNITVPNALCNNGGAVLTIFASVDSFYTNKTATSPATQVVTVRVPGKDNVSGGGYLVMQNSSSAGKSKGKVGTKTNFGFTMKFNKSGKNLQGKATVIIRAENDSMYQIKSNALNSLTVNGNRAYFSTKANVTNITDPDAPYPTGDGNQILLFEVFDSTRGGQADSVGITFQDNAGGLIYSSEWNGIKTALLALRKPTGGGNVSVMSLSTSEQSGEGVVAEVEMEEEKFIPKEYELYQNYPNPFNPSSRIQIDLPENSTVRLIVYDILGREVVILINGVMEAGRYRQLWHGRDQYGRAVASGVYFYRIEASSLTSDRKLFALKKMVLLK